MVGRGLEWVIKTGGGWFDWVCVWVCVCVCV